MDATRVTRAYYVLSHCCWQEEQVKIQADLSVSLSVSVLVASPINWKRFACVCRGLIVPAPFVCIGESISHFKHIAAKWFLVKIERTWHIQVAPSPSMVHGQCITQHQPHLAPERSPCRHVIAQLSAVPIDDELLVEYSEFQVISIKWVFRLLNFKCIRIDDYCIGKAPAEDKVLP